MDYINCVYKNIHQLPDSQLVLVDDEVEMHVWILSDEPAVYAACQQSCAPPL